MNKIIFIKIFLLTIVFIILGIDLFTDYTLSKWIKAIGFLFLSILALIDLIKKKDWFCKLLLKEFWNFFIFNFFFNIIFKLLDKRFSQSEYLYDAYSEYLYDTYIVIVTLALVAVGYRRLKNAGYSGWLFLIPFVNLILALRPQKQVKVS